MNLADKQNIISTIFDNTNLVSVNASLTNTGDARNELQKIVFVDFMDDNINRKI